MQTINHTAARFGTILGRQAPAQALTVDAIADDAIQLARLGLNARRALERRRCPGKFVERATAIAERYGAELIDQRDLNGAVMALTFRSGLYSAGFRNLFYVA